MTSPADKTLVLLSLMRLRHIETELQGVTALLAQCSQASRIFGPSLAHRLRTVRLMLMAWQDLLTEQVESPSTPTKTG